MIKSMTGFGRGEYIDENIQITVEAKALNNRYSEFIIRMPRVLNPVEDKIKKKFSEKINRGRVDIFINITENSSRNCEIKVDKELAAAYNNALDEVANTINVKNEINSSQKILYIMRSNGVINMQEIQSDVDYYWPFLEKALDTAIQTLFDMRAIEGENIYKDLLERIELLNNYLVKIEELAPKVSEDFYVKISKRVNELLSEYEQKIDKNRMYEEVAIFSDKVSITEEIVRLKSHIDQFKDTLEIDNTIGRKLDFIVQEFNREVNTIASKANDSNITQITIEMKSEIEKIREQIQNIE